MLVEVILAFIGLIVGNQFWRTLKRDWFLSKMIHDDAFLAQIVSSDTLNSLAQQVSKKGATHGFSKNHDPGPF
jgi:hypothetical protein